MQKTRVAILHYSAPPVVGGVEAVMQAHARQLHQAGYPTAVIAGRGAQAGISPYADWIQIPEIDSQHPDILEASAALEKGQIPANFEDLVNHLEKKLAPILKNFDVLIIHNLFTKHFNLPLTAALKRLVDQGLISQGIAWCHDFTWTSPNSRSKVHPGYPWDLLRTQHPSLKYVVVSKERQQDLASLFVCPLEQIKVIYNGVEPQDLLALSNEGMQLVERLGLLNSDLNLLMPVRVTQAKNIEYALQVLAEIIRRGVQAKLVLTGPPDPHDAQNMDYYQSLRQKRADLGIDEQMRFVFESGPEPKQPYQINSRVVGDLFRLSDLLFMPSHREGFGMPILEAGLAGIPIVATEIPAAVEIAAQEVILIKAGQDPKTTADQIMRLVENNPISRLRRRVRQDYSWEAIFKRDIESLLVPGNRPC
jgi:glycosyltransferase involved in cell wall biosynthesis